MSTDTAPEGVTAVDPMSIPPVPVGTPDAAAAAAAAVAPGEDLLASDPSDPAAIAAAATAAAAMDGNTHLVDCPPGLVGRVIGKGGETIKGLQAQSGAHITIDQNFPDGVPRKISISGPAGCVEIATKLVEDLLKGGPVRSGTVGPGQAQQLVECPKEMVGRVIGRGGETIKGLQSQTGARIQIDQSATPCTVTITGNPYCVEAASRAVTDVINGGSTAPYSAANQHQLASAAAAMYGHHPGYGGHPGHPHPQFGGYAPHMGGYGGYPGGYPGGGYPGGGFPHQGFQGQQHHHQQQQGGPMYAHQHAAAQHQAAGMYAAAQAQAQAVQAAQAAQQAQGGAMSGPGQPQGQPGAPPQPNQGQPGQAGGSFLRYAGFSETAGAMQGQAGGGQPEPGTKGGAPGGAPAGGSEWQPLDDGRGRTYYYNTVTGASQWEKPVA